MKNIRVIVKKVPIYNKIHNHQTFPYINNFIDFQNSLTRSASIFPGFIKSNSYWKLNGEYDIRSIPPVINISTWNSKEDWEVWSKSMDRKLIQEHYYNIEYKETIDVCIERVSYIDTPLL